MGGHRVVAVLALVVSMRGKPQSIPIGNGPEFISKALDARAFESGPRSTQRVFRRGASAVNLGTKCFTGPRGLGR